MRNRTDFLCRTLACTEDRHIPSCDNRTSTSNSQGKHNTGQNTRTEREAERFSLIRAQRDEESWAGIGREGLGEGRLRRKYWDMISYFTWHQKTTRPRDFYSASVRLG